MKKNIYTHRITIRMDDVLFQKIENGAKAGGISQVEFVRRLLKKGRVSVNQEIIAEVPELKRLIGEFGKIGSNLNQIAHYYNGGGVRSREMYDRIQRALSELYGMKYEVEKMGGEFRGYLKHGSIRNSDYGEAQRYLLFEHDADTQKPILDENGDMILRKGLIQSGINCDPFTFNTECTELNRKWGKNLGKKDVKAHHYILSFDPRDVTENGLTAEHAHAIAQEFASRFFAGHQVLLVTHVDGHNHSGNIHTHIVFNSLRKGDVPHQDFMERPIDARAGYKHHQTRDLLAYMQLAANEICAREHLHTVDYTLPTERRITDREYQAQKKGQQELDGRNEEIIYAGFKPRRTEFETIKEQIRKAIDQAAQETTSEEQFKEILETRFHITVSYKRGAWSFLPSGRNKPIRDRSLGRTYQKEEISKRIGGPEKGPTEIPPEYASLPKIFLINSDLKLVVDIQNCVKAQQSRAYARKVAISNLQQMAKSVVYIQTHGIGTMDNLKEACKQAEQQYQETSENLRKTRADLCIVNEHIHFLGQYLSAKSVYRTFLASSDKPAFRLEHRAEIDRYEEARSNLRRFFPNDSFPDMKALKTKKDQLQRLLNQQKNTLQSVSKKRRKLDVVLKNIEVLSLVQEPFQEIR